ncbi:MAG: flavodoxin [Clostridia bacterium]|nr:flavodoxin [Clostridia bacterium]
MLKKRAKLIVDVLLGIGLLLLMSYQVAYDAAHEWTGICMTALMATHQILNRKWYIALFRGKYGALRIFQTVINLLLVGCFLTTALCGINMSVYAVPFLADFMKASTGRRMHLALSHWSFILMGLHLGLHLSAMVRGAKRKSVRRIGFSLSIIVAGCGLWIFLRNNFPDYLLFQRHFAFIDYGKAAPMALLEALLIVFFFAFVGMQLQKLLTRRKEGKAIAAIALLLAVMIGIGSNLAFPAPQEDNWNAGETPWGSDSGWTETEADEEPVFTEEAAVTARSESEAGESILVEDGFVLIEGGSFLMGSLETENWRIDDETQHEVYVSDFRMSPYEVTQAEYQALMGENPSQFSGENLPVENVTWLDAVRFCNAKSEQAGLTPVYTIEGTTVIWDRSAEGYRLPTEAEWEYACRAGTVTPFWTDHAIGPEEANYYGHYPYEIEENYFNDSVLETRPGRYRQTTVDVGSFDPNPWGLYNIHGNVNEWCWDLYGEYDLTQTDDPTGALTGTRRVYRGGGWNDFGKNLRSAYRATGELDMASFNLGIRLVRNASNIAIGTVVTRTENEKIQASGKVLIAYFSWSGNTRGVAQEIQRQTGADLFEISPLNPYSDDYNTVLMEAQRDQHDKARPELDAHIENFDQYDVILLGYPNWWASIPMPIATFLEEYDFSGKIIVPFCSHGGGRFGQSITAIAKLAPDSEIGTGLSIHYSGGSSLPEDVRNWLTQNSIPTQD